MTTQELLARYAVGIDVQGATSKIKLFKCLKETFENGCQFSPTLSESEAWNSGDQADAASTYAKRNGDMPFQIALIALQVYTGQSFKLLKDFEAEKSKHYNQK